MTGERATPTPSPLTSRFDDALMYASDLHRQQFHKGTSIPYVSHLLAVSAIVMEHGGDEDEDDARQCHTEQGEQLHHLAATVSRLRARFARVER